MDHSLFCDIYMPLEKTHLDPHIQKYLRLVIHLHLNASGPCLVCVIKFAIHTCVSNMDVCYYGQAVKMYKEQLVNFAKREDRQNTFPKIMTRNSL